MKSRWGGIKAYWYDENGKKRKTKVKFGLMDLSMEKLVGLSYVESGSPIYVKFDADKMRFTHRANGTLDK